MQYGMYSVAVKYLLLAFHYNKKNILVLFDLALSYDKLGDPSKSLMYYRQYLDIDPFAEHVWNNLGLIYTRTGVFDMACEAYDFSICINPQFLPAYFCKADMFILSNRIKDAIDVYNELLSEDNCNTKALCDMGKCYIQIGDFLEALRLFKLSIDISSEYADAWYGIAIVYYRQRRYTPSINSLKKAIDLDPDNSDHWSMLGEVFNKTRKLNKAIDAYTRATELNPGDFDSRLACAQVLFKKRRIHEAIYLLMRIYEIEPDNALVNYRLAAYYAYQQNLFEAQRFFKRALVLNFNDHLEMFRHFPKTKSLPAFRLIVENHCNKPDSFIRVSK
jgi:tetratricopeptide (TPR) repeat protein